ncbi:MAG: T9SS type A sorting domain-containing protein [Bacteroidia bacterium]|nr:T9SS type A sorting domain-containing protein [Bacteroidia bacterium]
MIESIQGASSSSPVIFESESGDSSLVVLQGDSVITPGYVLKVNAAANLVFKGITFKNTGSNDTLVNFVGATSHLRFLNNQFLDTDGRYFVYSKIDSNDSLQLNGYNEFRSNLFKGNSNSRVFFNTNNQVSAYPNARGNNFIHNNFVDGSGLYLYGQQSVQISNNVFISNSVSLTGGCSYIDSGTDIRITNNTLINAGIDIRSSSYSDESIKGIIANNFIYADFLNSSWLASGIGMFINGFKNIDVIFNTIHTKSNIRANSLFATLRVYQGQSINCRILNNIIYNEGQAKALNVEDTPFDIWDYNSIYTTGDTFASFGYNYYVGSLSDWQDSTSYEQNSLSIAPEFISDSLPNLQLGSQLCGRGIWMDEVTTDIYGNARSNPPTIGAFELPTPCTVGFTQPEGKAKLFELSPNPATETLNIMYAGQSLHAELQLTNTLGQEVLKKRIQLGLSAIGLADVEQGVYLCKLVADGKTIAAKRLVVVR